MNKYIIRSTMVMVVFFNTIICLISAWVHYRDGYVFLFPHTSLLWTGLFLTTTIIIAGHKSKNSEKAILNGIFLLLIGLIFLFISIVFTPNKGRLFLIIASLMAIYLGCKHEGITFFEMSVRLLEYINNGLNKKLKSSFVRYLIFEFVLFVSSVGIFTICLKH